MGPWCFRGVFMARLWVRRESVMGSWCLCGVSTMPPSCRSGSMVLSWWVHGASIVLRGVSMVLSFVGGVPMVPHWCLHREFVVDPSFSVHDASTVPRWGPWSVHDASIVRPWWVHGGSVAGPWCFCGVSTVPPSYHCGSMVLPWGFHGVPMMLLRFHGDPIVPSS